MRFQKFITVNVLAVFLGSTLVVPTTAIAQSNTGTTSIIETSNTLTAKEQAQADKLARDIITIQAIVSVVGEKARTQLSSALQNGTDVSIDINATQLKRINSILQKEGVELLPSSTRNFQIIDGNYAVGVENSDGSVQIMTRSVGDTAWKVTKCGAALALAIYPGTKAYKFAKGLGGIKQTAQLLVGAATKAEKKKFLLGLGMEVMGIADIEQYCLN